MDRIQTPGKQDPGRQEPLELPGRNSSTYGDGDIPEIDLPGADNATHDFLRNFLKPHAVLMNQGCIFPRTFPPFLPGPAPAIVTAQNSTMPGGPQIRPAPGIVLVCVLFQVQSLRTVLIA